MLASRTETGTNYYSDHDVFDIMFCDIGGEFTAGTSSFIKEVDNTFGQDDSSISKIWIIIDSQ